jgi:hypothetical protein
MCLYILPELLNRINIAYVYEDNTLTEKKYKTPL